jgi:uncharacterized membrane protein YphA (DoxX/SURF4 family)
MNKLRKTLDDIAPIARVFLGAVFVYTGFVKAFHPVEFLKLLREYNLTENFTLLNLIAGALPWFEVFIGLLLVLGVGVRGAGLLALAMLVPFTIAVGQRAAAIHAANGTAFCGIRFNCGCGTGEVLICRKLAENAGLLVLAVIVAFVRAPRAAFRYRLFGERAPVLGEPAAD